MPGIRAMSVDAISTTSATVTLDTHAFGLLLLDARKSGNDVILTMYKDGIQQSQKTVINPPNATLEAEIDAAVTSMLPGGFKFASHLVSVNPLIIRIICSDIDISSDWWTRK